VGRAGSESSDRFGLIINLALQPDPATMLAAG
jgi:hypothetical protein